MRAKLVRTTINENAESSLKFHLEYFNDLVYVLPENRFEDPYNGEFGGTEKGNIKTRLNLNKDIQNSDINKLSNEININEINNKFNNQVDSIINFLKENILVKNIFELEIDKVSKITPNYINNIINDNDDNDFLVNIILLNDKKSLGFNIGYDPYKNTAIITIPYDGDMFYYYQVFTLGKNDVQNSGELFTYITPNDFINEVFYETTYREILSDLSENIDPDKLSEYLEVDISKHFDEPNLNFKYKITNNYLTNRFKILFLDYFRLNDFRFDKKYYRLMYNDDNDDNLEIRRKIKIKEESERKFANIQKKKIKEWFDKYAPSIKYEISNGLIINFDGNLIINGQTLDWIPDNLSTANGRIDFSNCIIKKHPMNTSARKLSFRNTNLKNLDKNFQLYGSLDISNNPISDFPKYAIISGNVKITNTNINKNTMGGEVYGKIID